MTSTEILEKVDALNIWKQGDQRAPHKPLLILYALGRWQQQVYELTFLEVEPALTQLLQEFGPYRKSHNPQEPFWRLQNDQLWKVDAPPSVEMKTGSSIPRISELRSESVRAGFVPDLLDALNADPKFASQIATRILDEHFPDSLHDDILNAVGLTLEYLSQKRQRDPAFRQKVLKAYNYCCAICGFNVRLENSLIGLDAAHIRWHQASGPDVESNGLALCALHHKTFDRGAFTLKDGRLLVSDLTNGSTGLQEQLLEYHGKLIREPQNPAWSPDQAYLEWHRREVFKGEPRFVAA